MVKNSNQRHHNARLLNKWTKLSKHYEFIESHLALGKVFKQDPFDCGNPQCGVCKNGVKKKRDKFTTRELMEDL